MLKLRQIPNIISIMRLILVVPFVAFLLSGDYRIAFYLFTIAGISDAVDGFLARQFNWSSNFGAFIDPLADKILLVSGFVGLAWLGQMPMWVAVLIVLRDIIIMSGILGLYYVVGDISFKPTLISKLNTVLQVLLIFLILLGLSFVALPSIVINSLMFVMVLTVIFTLVDYVWVWGHRALRAKDAVK